MLDRGEADDKIIAVLKDDATYGSWSDVAQAPAPWMDRLRHYFLTYKQPPGALTSTCEIAATYGRGEAHEVIRRSLSDYKERFGNIEEILTSALNVMR
jgi:inorganic pyrophosphatase